MKTDFKIVTPTMIPKGFPDTSKRKINLNSTSVKTTYDWTRCYVFNKLVVLSVTS